MKKFLFLLIGLFATAFAADQESEFKQLLLQKNEKATEETKKPLGSQLEEKSVSKNLKALIVETYFVSHVHLGGYEFHVADYKDGTKIVTCLDGSMRGLQGISYRGLLRIESRNVRWCGDYFVHFYPGGTVTSFSDRQISELY